MAFFKKFRKGTINSKVKVADIYVVTSEIISSYNDGNGCGPICVTMYFLAKCEGNEYYELFSGKKLEKKEQLEDDFCVLLQNFDTPYLEKAEPLTKYLTYPNQTIIDIQSLFDFITEMNVSSWLKTLSDKSK